MRTVRLVMAAVAVLLTAGALWAHAVAVPAVSMTRAYETYTLRMPNEKDVATVRIEIAFPPEIFVVSFNEVPSRTEVRAPDGAPPGPFGGDVLPPLAVFVAMIALVAAIRALRLAASGDR